MRVTPAHGFDNTTQSTLCIHIYIFPAEIDIYKTPCTLWGRPVLEAKEVLRVKPEALRKH